MKDEEMAEEWVRTKHNILKDCSSACVRAEHKNEIQAFLAGLKAGRPQWHKVADGDLPKENKLYFVAIKDNGCAIAYFNGLHWETKYNLGDFGHCVETVIAWCEIPTFDKE